MPSETPGGARRRFCTGMAAAVLAGLLPRTPAVAGGLRTGVPAPAARLGTLDGRDISTAELLGSVVILTFWATWCVPCREELPLLSDYLGQHAGAGLAILGFSLDTPDQLAQVRRVAQSLRFPVGLLSNSSAPGYGRIWRLPVSFTIDRRGLLVGDGWQEKNPVWTRERLEQQVTPLLASRAAAAGGRVY